MFKALCCLLLIVNFVSAARAEYSGVPFYSFKKEGTEREKFDSAAAIGECKKQIESEKKKIEGLGYKVIEESNCVATTESMAGGIGTLVRAYFKFLK